uniref:Uncharacterized protein n=1 Tax=Athene cunicularia TaxID=194338 RepID=A0A663M5U1_ATHCN
TGTQAGLVVGQGSVLETYPPLRVGVKPNSVHSPTDMSRELSTVTTAASARPHFDFTMSIFPEKHNAKSVNKQKKMTLLIQNQEGTLIVTDFRGGCHLHCPQHTNPRRSAVSIDQAGRSSIDSHRLTKHSSL